MSRLFGQITPVRPTRRENAFRVLEESLRRNQDRAVAGDFSIVGDMDEVVARNSSIFNEWHRPAP